MINNTENSLLLIIDIQEKLLNAAYNKESIAKNSEILSKSASILEIPTIISEQYPKGLGFTINNIKDNVSDTTLIIEKTSFSALEEDAIYKAIKKQKKKQIIICGIETHICVYQTIISLLKKGYDVSIIIDASGSRSEFQHNNALNMLQKAGANIKTTEMVLFELLKSSKHPKFKEVQNLIK
ncbi:isochorismatase family protein [bacterium]|nr:isochorismatase family protein [bacterium]